MTAPLTAAELLALGAIADTSRAPRGRELAARAYAVAGEMASNKPTIPSTTRREKSLVRR